MANIPTISDDMHKHNQDVFLRMGDEFLVLYLVAASQTLKGTLILSRLFAMGHSLELYAKANLAAQKVFLKTHDVPALVQQVSPELCLTPEEIRIGEGLFSPSVTNFDLGVYLQHRDMLELYQAEYFLPDLKYYTAPDGSAIYPALPSLQLLNIRYLGIVRELRRKVSTEHHDQELIASAGAIGFESNPAAMVVG